MHQRCTRSTGTTVVPRSCCPVMFVDFLCALASEDDDGELDDARFGLMFDLSRVAVLPAVQSGHVV
jgi:hypothetical protein